MFADLAVIFVGILIVYPVVLWIDRKIINRAEQMIEDVQKGLNKENEKHVARKK